MNEFNLTYNNNHNVRIVVEKDAICIDHIPSDGIYDSIIASLVDCKGNRSDSSPINKCRNRFYIQLHNVQPGKYSLSCFKRSFAFEPYSYWFGKIPISIDAKRIVSFEKSPVYDSNVNCFQQMVMKPVLKEMKSAAPSRVIELVAYNITRNCSTSYDAALAIHDFISQTIGYDLDACDKILKKESTDYSKVSTPSLVLESSKGVCSGFSNLAVSMFTSLGIPAKTISCYALGYSTEGKWSETAIQSSSNHVITAVNIGSRWLLMDTTWDCKKKYRGERVVEQRPLSREYFDPTLQFLSCTHRILQSVDC